MKTIILLFLIITLITLSIRMNKKYNKYAIAYIDGDEIKYVEFINENTVCWSYSEDKCLKFDTLEETLREKDKCRFAYKLAIVFI